MATIPILARDYRKICFKYHASFFYAGATKVNVSGALFDDYRKKRVHSSSLLARPASLLQKSVQPALAHSSNNIDDATVLFLDVDGPCYMNAARASQTCNYSRVGDTYYTRNFAELFVKEAMLQHGRAKPIQCRIQAHIAASGGALVSLLPADAAI